MFAAGAVTYLALLPLRVVPSAWETANRASDFLYVGIGLMVALAAHRVWRPRRRRWLVTLATSAYAGVIAVGGVIAGWPPELRLSQPYRATVNGHVIEPQGVALARWSLSGLGPNQGFVADQSNGLLLAALGRQLPRIGNDGVANAVLEPTRLDPSVVNAIASAGIQYVAVDRRAVASDNLAGYFFAPAGKPPTGSRGLVDPGRVSKLDVPGVSRVFDSGDIVVYDVRRLSP